MATAIAATLGRATRTRVDLFAATAQLSPGVMTVAKRAVVDPRRNTVRYLHIQGFDASRRRAAQQQAFDTMAKSQGRFGLMLVTVAMFQMMPARAGEYLAGAIKVVQPWTRQAPAAAKVAGGFMTLTNTGTVADRLIGGTIGNAARFEIHEMSIVDGMMRMRHLQSGLEIKPGETVVLKPGSYHVMFMDLSAAPEVGKHLKGTLVFEKGGSVEIEYTVEPAGAAGSDAGGHGGAAAKSGQGSGSGSGAVKNGNQ